uniref:Sialin n=2 Tax=Cacopsylla melanoneura TaxID=428564 RepID=A0A8D9FAW6_9HEMI
MGWTVRRGYWYVCFFGFACNYMIRVNLNIAITAMVRTNAAVSASSDTTGSCVVTEKHAGGASVASLVEDEANFLLLRSERDTTLVAESNRTNGTREQDGAGVEDQSLFLWDSHIQNFVLGSFFWLHWTSQIPGGILARTLGTKTVFGLSNLAMFIISFMLPAAAYWDHKALAALRVVQGLIGGLAWPSMHYLVAHWIPPNERSIFMTSYLGSSFGLALSYPLCGFVIDLLGWEAAFYITGAIGVVWYLVWMYMVYDTPDQHPRISVDEKEYIQSALGDTVSSKKLPVPWGTILTSVPVWSTMLVQWGVGWGLHTLMTQGPSYLKYVYGWKPSQAGIWLGVPHLVRTACAVIFSWTADKMLTTKFMGVTGVRKTFIFVGACLHGMLLFGVAFSGCNAALAILFLTLSTATTGASAAGQLAIMIDLAPNFASVLQGVSGMLGVIPGFISPLVVAYFTQDDQSVTSWQKVFILSAVVIALPGFLYMFLGTAKIQPWNDPINKPSAPANGKHTNSTYTESETKEKTTKF